MKEAKVTGNKDKENLKMSFVNYFCFSLVIQQLEQLLRLMFGVRFWEENEDK